MRPTTSTACRSSAPRRSGRAGRLSRRGHQDRRDRHRHRLHPRQLRRPRHRGRSRRRSADTPPAEPTLFGPAAPKVKGGTTWSATPTTPTRRPGLPPVPHPDRTRSTATATARTRQAPPRALACAAGATYTGPYNESTTSLTAGTSGPALRPRPTCTPSVSSAAPARPIDGRRDQVGGRHEMDVINMSLGAPLGRLTSRGRWPPRTRQRPA